jgi:colanic acid biosynthesis glycosyl transferase WcaI
MKILIITPYFYPENFRINDFAFKMSKRGHSIAVLTGMPNYPEGKFFGKYRILKKETFNNVEIYRVPIIPRGNSNKINLFINYLSFLISGIIFGPFLLRSFKPNLIFAINYTPPSASIIGYIMGKIYNAPLYLWIQDLWPESLTATNTIKSKFILNFVKKVMTFLYNSSSCILVQSRSFVEHIKNQTQDTNKIYYFPNWAEDSFNKSTNLSKNKYSSLIPDNKFIIMFAGNLGIAQSLETIIEAALLSKKHPIHWVFLGDGRQINWLKDQVRINRLENVSILGRYPLDDMPLFFNLADAMLVTLKKDPLLNLTVPGKVQSYLKFGKPILSAIDGDGSLIISESNSGYNSPSEDGEMLSMNAIRISQLSDSELKDMSQNAKQFYSKNFESSYLFQKFEDLANKIGKKQ